MSDSSQHPPDKPDANEARAEALERVRLPATILLIAMSVLMVLITPLLIFNIYVYFTYAGPPPEPEADVTQIIMRRATDGSLSSIQGILALTFGTFILIGAVKMRRLKSRGWAIAACVLSLIPGFSPCCLVGLPLGVWGLMTVNDAEVKAAFEDRKS